MNSIDVNIIITNKSKNQNQLEATSLRNDYKKGDSISKYFDTNKITLHDLGSDGWFVGDKKEVALKQKIQHIGIPLKDWDVSINYGVKTGNNSAFIISRFKRDELISIHSKSEEIIKPVLRGRDLNRYSYNFQDLYIITTFPALNINIDDYPAIRDYLKSFGKKLYQTGERFIDENGNITKTRKKTGNKWYETQDQISYYSDFDNKKIGWTDIATKPTFSFVNPNVYFNNTVYMLSGKNLDYLLTILNSKICSYIFPMIASSLGEKGARYFKIFVEKIPVPKITPLNRDLVNRLETLCDLRIQTDKQELSDFDIEQEIDQLVYDLYELTEEEIGIIENSNQ